MSYSGGAEFSFKRLLLLAVPAALVAIALRVFVFGLYVVPSSSMAPTLLIGDYIFATKYDYGWSGVGSLEGFIRFPGRVGGHPPQRGDVIVFKSPSDNRVNLLKRLVGLPGDQIEMRQSELYINGKLVKRERLPRLIVFPGDDEPATDIVDYVEYLPGAKPHVARLIRELEDEITINNTDRVTVPPGSYFFMGDNRDRSDDSRVGDVGFVPAENIVGRARFTFFSMSKDAGFWEFSKWSWALRRYRLWREVE